MSNNQRNKSIAEVNRQMEGVEAIAVSSKDILGFDKLSRAILEFASA
jgi:hypothetical protein